MQDPRSSSLINLTKKEMKTRAEARFKHHRQWATRMVDKALKEKGRVRKAADILRDLGDPDCPPDTIPSGELFREARVALGLTQAQLQWALGGEKKRAYATIASIERGRRPAKRYHRLLLIPLLRKLEQKQAAEEVNEFLKDQVGRP